MANSRLRLHLATGNPHKVAEFQLLAERTGIDLEFVRAEPMPPVLEDTGTFEGNARKKALALKALLPPTALVLADDSGLCVDALGGAPGVESAYFAGPAGDSAANLAKLVADLRAIPPGQRGAHFVCVLVLIGATDAESGVFFGRCEGSLRLEPTGGAGFGYDPLFIPADRHETYAELGDDIKNTLSHRALAFQQLARRLKLVDR